MKETWVNIKTKYPFAELPVIVEYVDDEGGGYKVRSIAYHDGERDFIGLDADEISVIRWKYLPIKVYKTLIKYDAKRDWNWAIIFLVDKSGRMGRYDSLALIRDKANFIQIYKEAEKRLVERKARMEEYVELLCAGDIMEKYHAPQPKTTKKRKK